MIANLTCPICGHQGVFADHTPGQEVRCPACFLAFPTSGGQGAGMPSASSGSPAGSPNRTVMAQPEPMMRYNCPRCKKALESPVSFAGQKLNCPDCNQRLQIPQAPASPGAPPVNKTILATSDLPSAPAANLPPPIPPMKVAVIEETPADDRGSSGRGDNCLECGAGLAKRGRVQSCPDCAAQLCSAQCYREHRYHAHEKRRKSRPRNVECERCGSNARPVITTAISDGGWVTFVIMLIVCFPLFWIGLLMTEDRVTCSDCGARLQ